MSIRMLKEWVRERYGGDHFAFAVFLGVAATTAFDVPRVVWAVAVGWVGLGALRLGDDLVDRSKDRGRFPLRFVVREPEAVSGLAGFVILGCLLAGFLIFLWKYHAGAAFAFGCLLLGLVMWYGIREKVACPEQVHSLVILLKYPALLAILLLAAGDSLEPVSLVMVYLLMILHERATSTEDPPPWAVVVKKWRYALFGLGLLLIVFISSGKNV